MNQLLIYSALLSILAFGLLIVAIMIPDTYKHSNYKIGTAILSAVCFFSSLVLLIFH